MNALELIIKFTNESVKYHNIQYKFHTNRIIYRKTMQ